MYKIKAYAKVNIFLKITGHKDGYHTLISRFIKVNHLYDTLSFVPDEVDSFTINGCGDVTRESNTIYKAYTALLKHTNSAKLEEFFHKYRVLVVKNIPSQAGLGGGSSDAAAFMRLTNEVCGLDIDIDTLADISSSIGADLPFFIYNYPSANVSGFGEIVESFEEEALDLELYTPDIGCDTAIVYKTFKQELLSSIDTNSFAGWEEMKSKEILKKIKSPTMLNDLYASSIIAYPELKEIAPDDWFFSGSGSTYFRLKD